MNRIAKYTFLSPEVQQRLQEIKRRIYLKMNGVTVEQMKNNGVVYSKNYGVSLPEIKLLAGQYAQDAALAQVLWHDNGRETMLLATFLHPAATFDETRAEEWVGKVTTLELAENLSRNLLCRLPFAGSKAVQWIRSDDCWACAVGYFTAAFAIGQLSTEQKRQILASVKQQAHIAEVAVYRAIALFVRKVASESAETLMRDLSGFESSALVAERIIYEELRTEAVYRVQQE